MNLKLNERSDAFLCITLLDGTEQMLDMRTVQRLDMLQSVPVFENSAKKTKGTPHCARCGSAGRRATKSRRHRCLTCEKLNASEADALKQTNETVRGLWPE